MITIMIQTFQTPDMPIILNILTVFLLYFFFLSLVIHTNYLLLNKSGWGKRLSLTGLVITFTLFVFVNTIFLFDQLYTLFSSQMGVDNTAIILSATDVPNHHGTCNPQDPVRFWPSGTAQTASIAGAGVLVYRALAHCNPRTRVIVALGTAGVATANIAFHTAVENPYGFSRLMYGISTYSKTKQWPSDSWDPNKPSQVVMDFEKNVSAAAMKDTTAMKSVNDAIAANPNPNVKSTFMPENFIPKELLDSLWQNLTDVLNNYSDLFLFLFKPAPVNGFLDDLWGQQYFIFYVLLICLVSILFLSIAYFINILIYLNKDRIAAKFKNKYILFYINYQSFFIKLALFYLPILIIFSLFLAIKITYFLVCHPIPLEALNMDLHVWVSNKNLFK